MNNNRDDQPNSGEFGGQFEVNLSLIALLNELPYPCPPNTAEFGKLRYLIF